MDKERLKCIQPEEQAVDANSLRFCNITGGMIVCTPKIVKIILAKNQLKNCTLRSYELVRLIIIC